MFKNRPGVNTPIKEVNYLITFIKDHNLITIRKKLIILYLLNVTDIIFTLALLQTGLFREMNIFMVNAVQSPLASIVLKIFIPAGLLFFLYKRICLSDGEQLKAANIGLLISMTLYALVNLSHLIWVSLLPMFWQMV
jgi:hypothetical protein